MSVRKMVPLYVARGIANPESPDPIAHAVDAIPVADMREAWWCDSCLTMHSTAAPSQHCSTRRVLIADHPDDTLPA